MAQQPIVIPTPKAEAASQPDMLQPSISSGDTDRYVIYVRILMAIFSISRHLKPLEQGSDIGEGNGASAAENGRPE
jgi:hypothetical protein